MKNPRRTPPPEGGTKGGFTWRETGCDAHHVYTGTRNEAHMSPSQGSQLRFTKMSSWCATLPRLTASVDQCVPSRCRVRLLLLASPYLDILTEHYRFQYVYGILNLKTTKIDIIRNKGIADFTR